MAVPAPAASPHESHVTLRYWASARAAAGSDADVLDVDGPTTLAALLQRARSGRDRRFADVIGCCSVMLGDRPVTTEDATEVVVPPGATVEFLPPFAGG